MLLKCTGFVFVFFLSEQYLHFWKWSIVVSYYYFLSISSFPLVAPTGMSDFMHSFLPFLLLLFAFYIWVLCCWIFIYMLLLSRLSRVQLCATLWTAAHQAPLSMGFSRQEYGRGLPFPSPIYIFRYLLKLLLICPLYHYFMTFFVVTVFERTSVLSNKSIATPYSFCYCLIRISFSITLLPGSICP